MEERKLSIPGALVGALVGLGAEIALREMTGLDVIEGILEIIGAGFGLIRIDRKSSSRAWIFSPMMIISVFCGELTSSPWTFLSFGKVF